MSFAAVIAMCVALGGCGGPDEPKRPTYAPIPDKQLFAKIEAIPGVSKLTLNYRDEFGNGNDYVGEIFVSDDAGAKAILDQALAILRQGHVGASMTVVARQKNRRISTDVLDLKVPSEPYLSERYGKQPGNGKPPKTTPTPTP